MSIASSKVSVSEFDVMHPVSNSIVFRLCLRFLPRLLVLLTFTSVLCFRRQFLRMWPIQMSFCFLVCRIFFLPWCNHYIHLTSFCNIGMNNSTYRPKCKRCWIFTLPLAKQLCITQGKQGNLPSRSCGSDSNTNVVIFLYGVYEISLIVELHTSKCWLVYVSIWSAVPIVGISVSVSYQDVLIPDKLFWGVFFIDTVTTTHSVAVTSLEMGRSCKLNKREFRRKSLLFVLRCYFKIRHLIMWNTTITSQGKR
jgi:hypothetical protein